MTRVWVFDPATFSRHDGTWKPSCGGLGSMTSLFGTMRFMAVRVNERLGPELPAFAGTSCTGMTGVWA